MARAVCGQVLKAEADCGYCATRREHCYGLKAHLLIDWRGVAVGITVTAANVDERDAGTGLKPLDLLLCLVVG